MLPPQYPTQGPHNTWDAWGCAVRVLVCGFRGGGGAPGDVVMHQCLHPRPTPPTHTQQRVRDEP